MGTRKKIRVGVKILPKKEVLDVQGRAIAKTLNDSSGFVKDCRYGKFIQLTISAKNEKEALDKTKKITESVLCNALVETYEIELLTE